MPGWNSGTKLSYHLLCYLTNGCSDIEIIALEMFVFSYTRETNEQLRPLNLYEVKYNRRVEKPYFTSKKSFRERLSLKLNLKIEF